VLDTSRGTPAKDMPIKLEKRLSGQKEGEQEVWKEISSHVTDTDGRVKGFAPLEEEGVYRLTFYTSRYFETIHVVDYFYEKVPVEFKIRLGQHYHVPLLISPFGFSTYRGS